MKLNHDVDIIWTLSPVHYGLCLWKLVIGFLLFDLEYQKVLVPFYFIGHISHNNLSIYAGLRVVLTHQVFTCVKEIFLQQNFQT